MSEHFIFSKLSKSLSKKGILIGGLNLQKVKALRPIFSKHFGINRIRFESRGTEKNDLSNGNPEKKVPLSKSRHSQGCRIIMGELLIASAQKIAREGLPQESPDRLWIIAPYLKHCNRLSCSK